MSGFNKRALWDELDATHEEFVRQKNALGEYSPAKKKIVDQWLAKRDRLRQEEQAKEDARLRQVAVRWTKISAIAAGVTVVVTLLVAFIPK